MNNLIKTKPKKEKTTLCWTCKNNAKCEWSQKAEPVKDWVAKPTQIKSKYKNNDIYVKSYIVYECPKYEKRVYGIDAVEVKTLETLVKYLNTKYNKKLKIRAFRQRVYRNLDKVNDYLTKYNFKVKIKPNSEFNKRRTYIIEEINNEL